MIPRSATLFLALITILLSACAPATFTRNRMVFDGVSAADNRQEKEGVVAELKHVKDFPASFTANAQACDRTGRPLIDGFKNPIIEKVSLARPAQFWEQVALTNSTDHVLRMNSVVIRLFDPSGTQIEPLSWADLNADFLAERPCATSALAFNQFRVNKIFDRNMEIVPGSTATFWIPFRPPSMSMPGVWRFTIYEIPVRVDSAGRPTRTTQFDMRIVAKQFVDTYRQDSPIDRPVLVSSTEIPGAGVPAPRAPTPVPRRPDDTSVRTPEARQTPPPPPPASTDRTTQTAPPALTREVYIAAQTKLKALGIYQGRVDGQFGPGSVTALRKFQEGRGLPANGELTSDTLRALEIVAPTRPGTSPGSSAPPTPTSPSSPPARERSPEPPGKGERPKSPLEL